MRPTSRRWRSGWGSASGSCGGCSGSILGASPVAIAQTRRILLAKQLIQDTGLPMTEVAVAAGFGSLRRFNETFQQLYRPPPTALRRKGMVDARPPGAVTVRLGYRPPYDWDAIVGFLAMRAIPGVEVVSRERYARAIGIGGARACWRWSRRRDTACRRRCGSRSCGRCRRSLPGSGGCSTWRRIRWRSGRTLARTPCWRRWWRLGRGCGCRGPGMASSSRCGRSWASRSRWRRRRGWPESWWPAAASCSAIRWRRPRG